jgi:signal transduction histidine kinase
MELRVLVLAPFAQDARLAEQVLRSAGIESAVCASDLALGAELDAGAGALLVSEEALSEPIMRVLDRYIRMQPPWSDLPVLVLARRGADSLLAQRAVERLGNVTMLERPIRTITLITAMRSALRARSRQYETRMLSRRKDEFLATLAHELRNPLAPIRNATAVLARLHPTPQVASMVNMVERQLRHLTRLVDDLLDVARITSGKLELQLDDTTVQRVASHALEIAQAPVASRQQDLQVKLPQQEVPLRADHVRLVQAIANLLVNASKFTPERGHIALEVTQEGGKVEFVVRDDGRGLAPDSLERIFDMFEQAHAIGEPTGGLGLGLHLARAFARLHGGSILARSDGPGHGSEFILRLPVSDGALERPPERSLRSAGRELPERVLVVDDNLDAATTLQTLLSLHGIDVAVAHDGVAAVAHVREERPQAVVMDIGMPGMNGYEAAQHIRSAGGAQPLLIALTGWGQEADRARARAAGFDHHLVKPLDLEQLLDRLAEAVVQA